MTALLPYFPAPRPGELFYSIVVNYHKHSANRLQVHTMEDLFGSLQATVAADLPGKVGAICQRLHPKSFITAEKLIRDHTLYPFFAAFSSKERAKKVFNTMSSPSGGASIRRSLAISPGIPTTKTSLSYCRDCAEEDRAEWGEAYWHRSHQPFGVWVCPVHGTWLHESGVPANRSVRSLVSLNSEVMNEGRPFSLEGPIEIYQWMARAVKWLLDHSVPVHGPAELLRRYLVYFDHNCLFTLDGSINEDFLRKALFLHFPREILRQFGSRVDLLESDWLPSFLRPSRQMLHPIRYLLLMHYIGIEPQEFFGNWEVSDGATAFGEAPWPCPNPAADHFGLPVVHHVKIAPNPNGPGAIGRFECSCGFVYEREGEDRQKKQAHTVHRVISYGWVFKQKIRDLMLKKGKSTRQIAEILHVPEEVILRNLDSAIQGQYLKETGCSLADEDRRDSDDADRFVKFRNCRNHLLELIREYPEITRTELRRLAPGEYVYLHRFDRKWLAEVLPKRPHTRTKEDVEWKRKDQELSAKVAATALAIKEETSPSRRASKTAIAKALVTGPVYLAKLPLTEAALEAAAETVEQYQIRRVDRAAASLKDKGGRLALWKLMQAAGIPYGCSEKVVERMEYWCYG